MDDDVRLMVTRVVYDSEIHRGYGRDPDFPPKDWAGAMAWFAKKYELVPEPAKASAVLEIESEYGEGYSSPILRISYQSRETDEEYAQRWRNDRTRNQWKEAEERRMLAQLKAKYE